MESPAVDETFMARALELAALGPAADANPRVGCVLVRDSEVLGKGFHRGAGTPHAEAAALTAAREAGHDPAGATAYVTLEPCTHTGRTGPCAQALVAARVSRVVVAAPDPSDLAGGGVGVLRAAGIGTDLGVLRAAAEELVHPWRFAVTHGRPLVTWKYAATVDGFSAAADGSSRWITGPEVRDRMHRLRAECGAVVVGTGTVLADDPHLTARPGGRLAARQPLRVVVGEREVPAGARVLDDAAETLHLRTRDPREVLGTLHRREVRHVWLEGGPTLAAAFLRAGLVDEVLACLAPALLGSGHRALADLGTTTMDGIRRLTLQDVERVGDDVLLRMTTEEGR